MQEPFSRQSPQPFLQARQCFIVSRFICSVSTNTPVCSIPYRIRSVAAAVRPSLLGLAHIINSFITYLVSILSCIALPRFVLLVRAFHRTRVGLLPAYTF